MLRKKLKLSNIEEHNDQSEHNSSKQPKLDTSLTNENNGLQTIQSIYFIASPSVDYISIPKKMMDIQANLNVALNKINFLKHPVCYVYNPTVYAWEPYEKYLKLYCNNQKKIILMGMNPGPWGMCQTGIPFGEVNAVRDWLCINGNVGQPEEVCSNRKIEGFNCTRREVSGDRFWNFFKKLCDTPQHFFNNCFVYNYCPLAFMKGGGGNITPKDKEFEITLKYSLQEACDRALEEVLLLLKPELVIGIGRYAEERALKVVKRSPEDIKVLFMPHPSPRSVNNHNWPEKADNFIKENNLTQYFQ